MQFNPEAVNDDLLHALVEEMYPYPTLHAYSTWERLMRDARRGWVFSNSKHEVLMFPDEIACAVRRFLDMCERPVSDLFPARFGGVSPERIRAACMAVWGVPFYAGRGALTLCEPEPVRGALTMSAAGALEVIG